MTVERKPAKLLKTRVLHLNYMSQTRIPAPQSSQDWMIELEHDAQQFQQLVSRIDELAALATSQLIRHDYVNVGIRLAEIQEGLQVLCELAGIKVQPHVASA